MKYGLSEKQLEEIIAKISGFPEIEEAILFGSRAIDTFKEASDVDIALKGSKVKAALAAKLKFVFEEDTYLPFFFDFVAYPTITNEKLKEHINKKGVVLYRKDLFGQDLQEYRINTISTKRSAVQENPVLESPESLKSRSDEARMSGWRECTLGDILTLQRGYDLPSQDREIGTVPLYSSSGITDYQKIAKVSGPGVITGRYGTIGEVFFSNDDFWPLNTTLYVKDYKGNDPRFIYYHLKNLDFNEFNDKSAVPGINRNHVHAAITRIPPLPEQRAIASVLTSLDDKIDLLNRQNKTLEAMAETLFRQWFVEEENESWIQGKMPDEFDIVMGSSPPGESYNEIGIGMPMFQGNADFCFRFPQKRVFTTAPVRFAEKYDTLISVRAPVGDQNMAQERCCLGRGVAAFRFKPENENYTYTYFKMKSLMREIERFNDTGTVFGSIGKADFEAFDITIPPMILVKRFQQAAKPIDDKIISNTLQLETIEKLRDTLLPKLMNGEVRISLGGAKK